SLAPLLDKISALLGGKKLPDDCWVVVDNEIAPHMNAVRDEIRGLATAEMPAAARDQIDVLGDNLEIAERSKRINLKRVDDMAWPIRQHRLGALHRIEQLVAILIGKRAHDAPNWAIFCDELPGGGCGPVLVIVGKGEFLMGSPDG